MNAIQNNSPEPMPDELLLPLEKTGFLDNLSQLDSRTIAGIDALFPAPLPDDELAMFGFVMAHVYDEWIGLPDRTSLTGHWMAGALFSAAWTHVAGWFLDISVYQFHPTTDGPAVRVRIQRGPLPQNPVTMMELTAPNLPGYLH
jgi:hypothetical protein